MIEAGDSLKVVPRSDLDETISSAPAIEVDRNYIRTDNSLYAFGE